MRSTGLEHVKMHARKLLGFLRNSTLFWNSPQDVLRAPAPGLSAPPPVAVSVGPWRRRLGDGREGSRGGGRLELKGLIRAQSNWLFLSVSCLVAAPSSYRLILCLQFWLYCPYVFPLLYHL